MQRLLRCLPVLFLAACARPMPTCTDGRQNGRESDVDCGGGECRRCELARACETPSDCESGACRQHVCASPKPSCAGDAGCAVECLRNSDCTSGACVDGVCVGPCGPPLSVCGAGCVDLRQDPQSCGTCGRACAPNERCENAVCVLRCPLGTSPCGDGPSLRCLDLGNDVRHCGGCMNECRLGERCVAGNCRRECESFQVQCGGDCATTMTDVFNCGGCAPPCDPGELCSMGTCQLACSPPALACDAGPACVDPRFDPFNCGGCGIACPPVPNARPICAFGACRRSECNAGFADCNGLPGDGCEAELAVDPLNCGLCGRSCFGTNCMNGGCP
ncbi:MAG: hypothetical protein JNK82_18840 [Myxococcaceae bacterium]|nr:hypothetical protein [Myxococcaceae bacterium]